MIRIKIPYLITVVVSVLLLFIGHGIATNNSIDFQTFTQEIVRARVIEVKERQTLEGLFEDEIVRAKVIGIKERQTLEGLFEDEFADSLYDDFYPLLGERVIFEARIIQGTRTDEIVTASQDVISLLLDSQQREVRNYDYILLINTNNEWLFHEFDDGFSPFLGERVIFEARITHGIRIDEIVTASQSRISFLLDSQREVRNNDSVLLINTNNEWFLYNFYRINRLLILGFLFIFCVILFGGRKGFNTILSLGLTCAAIFAVFIPAILSGMNIYFMSILVCLYIIAMTLLIVIGYNKKSLAAVAGCIGGLVVAGIITVIMDRVLYFTGLMNPDSRFLANLPGGLQLNLRAIIFAGIIIGAMGAVMDVAISISSSLWEIKEQSPKIKFKELFRSGLSIGRDIMGSMANTLILAYIGSSLTVVLLLNVFFSGSLLGLFNDEMIAVEILQALAGSFGILFAMPLTAFFSSLIFLKEKEK